MQRIVILVFALIAVVMVLLLSTGTGRRVRETSAPADAAMPVIAPLSREQAAADKAEKDADPVRPAAAMPGSVTVRARDAENNKLLAGVRLSWLGRNAVIGDQGWVRIEAVPAGTEIRAACPGYEPAVFMTSGTGEEEALLMRARLDISVLDANTLAPLTGVRLTFDGRPVPLVDGMAGLPLPVPGPHKLEASLPGYIGYDRMVRISADERLVEIRLFPFRVEGEVVDNETGKPVKGARVVLLGHSISSDADGGFVFQGLPGMERLAHAGKMPVFVVVSRDGYEDARKRVMPMKLTDPAAVAGAAGSSGRKDGDAMVEAVAGWEARLLINLRKRIKP